MLGRLKKIAVAALVIYLVWKFLSGLVGVDASGADLLANRMWLERFPKEPRELVRGLSLTEVRARRVGVAAEASAFRAHFDLVEWDLDGSTLTVISKQDAVKTAFAVKIRRCAGEAPRPFDLCMDLSAGGRTWHYFSREAWTKLGEPVASDAELSAVLERGVTPDVGCPSCTFGLPRWLTE
ncbi:hypothetical protein L6R52_01565 [Myxococcota bacterium]|nr:hypothetical protein [Myxococcota bacterium]